MSAQTTNTTTQPTQSVTVATGDFWEKNGKKLITGGVIVLLGISGFFAYKTFVQIPQEEKASEALFKAEDYFRQDSLSLALNGDGITPGFLKVIDKYSGTKAANLAHYYAGSAYLNLGEFETALKHLNQFNSNGSEVLNSRALGLMGDAAAELDKKDEAVSYYKKAGEAFSNDELFSSEYLFRAGYLLESMGKNKEAIEQYKKIKNKYPSSQRGFDIDKYLARLGEVTE